MGLTQEALARISGLSRSTINALERHLAANLSIGKAEELLESIGLGINVSNAALSTGKKKPPPSRSALERAAATASTSYGRLVKAKDLEVALLTGAAPERMGPYLQVLLDEAPMSLLAKVVEELHDEKGVERSHVWAHMRQFARELQAYRPVWK